MEPILKEKRQVAIFLPYRKRAGGRYEFFLQKRDSGAPVHANMYGLFGGGIEKGETTLEALKREAREELLYESRDAQYLTQCSTGRGDFFIFIEEVSADFESRITVQEGEHGAFFTYDLLNGMSDISPIALVATESTEWYLNGKKDNPLLGR